MAADWLRRRVPGELRGSAGGALGCVRQGGAGLGVVLLVGHVAGDEVPDFSAMPVLSKVPLGASSAPLSTRLMGGGSIGVGGWVLGGCAGTPPSLQRPNGLGAVLSRLPHKWSGGDLSDGADVSLTPLAPLSFMDLLMSRVDLCPQEDSDRDSEDDASKSCRAGKDRSVEKAAKELEQAFKDDTIVPRTLKETRAAPPLALGSAFPT